MRAPREQCWSDLLLPGGRSTWLMVDGETAFRLTFSRAGLFFGGEETRRLWQGRRRIFFVTDRPADESVLRLITPQTRHLIGHEGRRWLFTNRPE